MKLTAIIEKSEDGWYVGQIEEFPAAISQGKTIDELKTNLIDAFMLLLETNKENTEKEYVDKNVIRENLLLV
ncbi:MAG: type II toxin-antitoxin system HicB family antitoxin [Bacteroidales bacterium]|nr:type II toxin-antitoxin system HicB family antitoxin [Bacteroidales bacterium]